MCTLMALYRRHREFPLVVAANRDERVDRPSAGPDVVREGPRAVGGKDLVAGGTWFGLNAHRILVAITNRRGGPEEATRRSRGILALDALGCSEVAGLCRRAEEASGGYNPFNLIVLGPEAGAIVAWDGRAARTQPVPPGALVITNGDANDRRIPNVARGLDVLAGLADASEAELVARLSEACADHRQEDPAYPPFCLHREPFGTVSSTILLVRVDGTGRYLFAPGPPCSVAYEDHSNLLPVRIGGENGTRP